MAGPGQPLGSAQKTPGAVPTGFTTRSEPSGSITCWKLLGEGTRPRLA